MVSDTPNDVLTHDCIDGDIWNGARFGFEVNLRAVVIGLAKNIPQADVSMKDLPLRQQSLVTCTYYKLRFADSRQEH